VEDEGLEATLDGLLLAALRRAAVDRQTGALDDDRVHAVGEGVLEVAEELPVAQGGGAPADASAPRVLVVPAGGDADRAASELLVRLLAARGVIAESSGPGLTSADLADRIERDAVRVVVVGALPPFAAPRVRYLVRRIRERAPSALVLAAVWNPEMESSRAGAALEAAGADRTAFTLAGAARAVREMIDAGDGESPAQGVDTPLSTAS
jgi:hypothetical protein